MNLVCVPSPRETQDIEVIDDPAALAAGTDPQLERGIAEALRLLEENPPLRPTRPAGPNRGGAGRGGR